MAYPDELAVVSTDGLSPEALAPNPLWGIIVRPVQTLTHLRDQPRGNWLAPVILAILIVVAQSLITVPVANQAATQQVERQLAQIPAEEQARVQSQMRQRGNLPLLAATTLVSSLMSLLARWFFRSGAIHLFSLALGGRNRFNQVFSMVVWTWVPLLIRSLLQTLTIALSGTLPTHQGLAAYVAALGDPLPAGTYYILLSQLQLDLFVLWNLLLLGLGVLIVTELSRAKALLVTAGYWLLATAFSVLPSLMGQVLLPHLLARG